MNKEVNTSIKLLTRKQVAAMLGVSTRTMYTVVQEGRFPAPIEVFGMPRWEEQTVVDFIKKAGKHKPRFS